MENTPAKLGRPTKLTNEILEKAYKYLMDGYKDVEDLVPSAVGLAQYLGVTKSTIYKWAEGEDEISKIFSDTLTAVVEKQEKLLISGGLSSAYNSTITKLMMANHGYRDSVKQELDATVTAAPSLADFYGGVANATTANFDANPDSDTDQ